MSDNDKLVQDTQEQDDGDVSIESIIGAQEESKNDNSDLQRQFALLSAEAARDKGRHQSAVGLIRKTKTELDEARREAEEVKAELNRLRSEKSASSILDIPKAADLSDEERSAFSNSIPTIKKLIQTELAAVLPKNFQAVLSRLDLLEQQFGESEKTGSARAAMLNARTVAPDMDELRRHPQFQQFLSEIDDVTDDTYERTLSSAIHGGKLKVVKRLFDEFRAKIKPRSGGAPALGISASQNSPEPSDKKLKMSDYRVLSARFRSGKITSVDWQKVRAAYDRASAEGRVINDS